MERPSCALWMEVSKRTDIENIIWELVGLTTIRLCNVAETSRGALGQTIRQSMFRLKVIFDTQSSHFVQWQFSKSNTAVERFGLSKKSCYEVVVYLTSLGTRLEPPERCGRQDYALQRALALDAFISAFRLLFLHRDSLRFEQEDLLRERVKQLTEAWAQQQILSATEDLLLNTIFPATLDELQETDGNSCIQQLGCARFSASSFERGRTPFCSDPTSPSLRLLSLKSSLQCVQSTLSGMTDVNLLEAFWTLHDVTSATLATVVQSHVSYKESSTDGQVYPAAATSGEDPLDAFQTISSSLEQGTAKKAVWDYIGGILSQLSSNSGMMIPTRGATSDRLKRSVNAEAAEFSFYLRSRSTPPSQQGQQNSLVDTAVGTGSSTMDAARPSVSRTGDEIFEDGDQQYSPPLQTQYLEERLSRQGSPSPPQGVVGGIMASPSISEASTSIDVRGHSQASPNEDCLQRSLTTVFENNLMQLPPGFGGPGACSSTEGMWVAVRSSSALDQVGASATRNATPFQVSAEYTSIAIDAENQRYIPYQPLQASPPLAEDSHLPEPHSPVVEPSGIPSYIDSGLQVVEKRQPVYKPPSPHRQIRPDPILPEVDHGSVHAPQNLPPRPSTPSSRSVATSRASFRKKLGVFGLFGGPKRAPAEPMGSSVPDDLQFRFSAAGTTLLLWPRRSPSHITKVPLPFQSGSVLDLYQQPDQNTAGRCSAVSVRLVEGGTNSVAVVILAEKTFKLLYFDQSGHKTETGLGQLTSAAACMAVSRDDVMIAVGCGRVIHLFRVINGMPCLTNSVESHSQCSTFSSDQYRIQRVNFSPDSTVMVAATQEYSGTHKYPVYLRLWNCLGMETKLEQELEPSALSLGYGDDTGLTGIFCAMDAARPENSRAFLTAACNKSYSCIFSLGKRGRHRHLDLAEKRIDNAAQASDLFAFKSGRHKLCMLDVVSGVPREIANFSAERANLKVQQDGMAIGMPSRGRLFAFWKSNSGALILKQVDVPENGGPTAMHTTDLRDIYLELNSTVII